MKKRITTALTLSVFFISILFLAVGCGKKTVIPPDTITGAEGGISTGNTINYPVADGSYSEENMPAEGTLDDTFNEGQGGSSQNAAGFDIEQQSDEYKTQHGRSSQNLFPVYFDFDQAGVRNDMSEILVSNATYIASIPGAMVIIEGNSDDRGTNEYNLALGERRAINVQQFLTNMGIAPDQMRTLSYGEEKPLFHGQDEESYSKNRRVDFIIEQ